MSTIAPINNLQPGGVIRGNLNTNFTNLNTDKHQDGSVVSYAGITNTAGAIINRQSTAVSTTFNGDGIMAVTNTAAARTITIDSAAISVNGKKFSVKDESGGATTFNITIATQGAETIDGAASISITVNYGILRLYSNGTNLFTR